MAQEAMLTVRQRLAGDFHRPTYHFLPPNNWMNDPNGFIQWKGTYHLFYQYNPNGAVWGDMHWGHATSPDLIHWADQPIALAPTPDGPDEAGCFSGCVVDNGLPTLFYTATRGTRNDVQTQALATSHDELMSWEKYPGNPILHQVPEIAHQTRDFRDPFVWKQGSEWLMVVGSRIVEVGGVVFLYRSTNLTDWEYLHPLLIGDLTQNGVIWECPSFFKLGDDWVLLISCHDGVATGQVIYFVGSFENCKFMPIHQGVLDAGVLYAPLSCVDEQQRRILIGWLRETRSNAEFTQAGWAGVQSIPRVLGLDIHKNLTMVPVPELTTLRGAHQQLAGADLSEVMTVAANGHAFDIQLVFDSPIAEPCGLSVACSPDGSERTDLTYDPVSQRLVIQSHSEGGASQAIRAAHSLAAGEALTLRILVDGSVLEVIANERTSLTTRLYPVKPTSTGLRLFATGAHLQALDVWEMQSIWQ